MRILMNSPACCTHRTVASSRRQGRVSIKPAGDRRPDAGREDDHQAPLRRPPGWQADPPRHRRDPRPLPQVRPPDRVARRGKMPAQRAPGTVVRRL